LGRDRLTIGLCEEALQKLETNLNRAHAAPNPTQLAKEVIRGWITSYAPGFESGNVEDVMERIRLSVIRCGFRESHERNALREAIGKAVRHWARFRENSLPTSVRDAAPPTMTALFQEASALRAGTSEVPS
jgi:hypothetical protein